jgi:hypothetical protein
MTGSAYGSWLMMVTQEHCQTIRQWRRRRKPVVSRNSTISIDYGNGVRKFSRQQIRALRKHLRVKLSRKMLRAVTREWFESMPEKINFFGGISCGAGLVIPSVRCERIYDDC